MRLSLPAAVRPLDGRVAVPGDKSLAHRAALFAALAPGISEIANYPDSGVTRAMRGALASLGVTSTLEDGVLRLDGSVRRIDREGVAAPVAYCGNSGTTFRLLAGALAATGASAVLDGSAGLRRRPMDRIAEPLRLMGADVSSVDGHAPLSFRPAKLHGIDYELPIASAQVLSCLQLAALGADSPSTFHVPGPVRDHTTRMLRAMGAEMDENGSTIRVNPLVPSVHSRAIGCFDALRPLSGTLPGDISSAAFLFAAAAIVPGSRVMVPNVGTNVTRTGILDVLAEMGAKVSVTGPGDTFGEPVGDVTVEAAPLRGVDIRGNLVVRCIDEFPAIAAVAAFAEGTTCVRDATELRYKESDRIAAIVSQFRALGAEVEEYPDGFSIRGGTLKGGIATAGGDHRLAMSLALCGLRAVQPVAVDGAEILDESFPGFVSALDGLRAGQSFGVV